MSFPLNLPWASWMCWFYVIHPCIFHYLTWQMFVKLITVGQQTFTMKDQRVNIWDFMTAAFQLSSCKQLWCKSKQGYYVSRCEKLFKCVFLDLKLEFHVIVTHYKYNFSLMNHIWKYEGHFQLIGCTETGSELHLVHGHSFPVLGLFDLLSFLLCQVSRKKEAMEVKDDVKG